MVREALAQWFDILRHSMDTKLMIRVPKKLLLHKANEFYNHYIASSITHGQDFESVKINNKWVAKFM